MSEAKKIVISKNEKRNMQQVVYIDDGGSVTRNEPIDPSKPSFPKQKQERKGKR